MQEFTFFFFFFFLSFYSWTYVPWIFEVLGPDVGVIVRPIWERQLLEELENSKQSRGVSVVAQRK